MIIYVIIAVFLLVYFICFKFQAYIFDYLMTGISKLYYRAVLKEQDKGNVILDVGIGTGKSLLENKAMLKTKNLSIIGVDINYIYVNHAKNLIE